MDFRSFGGDLDGRMFAVPSLPERIERAISASTPGQDSGLTENLALYRALCMQAERSSGLSCRASDDQDGMKFRA